MKHKKMYIVKREVLATSIEKALTAKGHIFEVVIADDKYQPEDKKDIGFKKKK